jgi:hypothetical protein
MRSIGSQGRSEPLHRRLLARTLALLWNRIESIFPMNHTLLWLIFAAALLVGFLVYRSRSGSNLNVDPHAREEIEKAKQR